MLSRRRDGRWRNSGRVRCPETLEEVGIDPESIRIVNRLDTIYTYSNFAMYCYLGIMEETALTIIKLNPDEVEEIFLVSIEWLMEKDPEIYWTEIVPRPPEDFPYDKVTGGSSIQLEERPGHSAGVAR